jgi:hypothetical protein
VSLSIEVKVWGGTSIDLAAEDAINLANRLSIPVRFKFNDVQCMAHPGGDPKVLADNWRVSADRGGMYPMASSNPRSAVSASESQT